jgi:3-polyprenyl-4-hydroxybenzoate decarboxylase
MIIDATGSEWEAQDVDIESLREAAKRIEGIEDITFPDKGSPLFAVVKAAPNAEASGILGSLGKVHRLIAIVDGDIDIEDPRETLWAVATRSQPVPDVSFGDGRILIDARKSEGWSATRATLPDSVRARHL